MVNELKPEFVGFVFWGKSKRNVTRQQALELKKALSPEIKAVGVFVDAGARESVFAFSQLAALSPDCTAS